MARRRTTRPLIITVTIAVTVVVLHAAGIITPLTDPLFRGVLSLAAPMYRIGAAITATPSDPPTSEEEASLDALIDTMMLENAKLKNALEEMEELKNALGYAERENDAVLIASVISERDGSFRGFTIDRGTDDGVVEGAPVLTADGVLVGKVSDVRRLTALVRSLTDSGSRLAVAIRNGNDTLGVLEGQRGLSMTISLIPQGTPMSPGDIVVTSGAESGLRRGYPVGTIEKVNLSTQDAFQTATVSPFMSADQPVFVQVVLPDPEAASL